VVPEPVRAKERSATLDDSVDEDEVLGDDRTADTPLGWTPRRDGQKYQWHDTYDSTQSVTLRCLLHLRCLVE
jgi:hypothetical protein